MIFHELTGINVIMQYSAVILESVLGSQEKAKVGTYVVAATNLLGSVMSLYTVPRFGKRPLLLLGHTGILLCHLCIGISIILDFDAGILIAIGLYLIIY
jgi:hypothetical protein